MQHTNAIQMHLKNQFQNRLKRSPEADFVSTYLRKHEEMREIWKKFRTKVKNHTETELIDEMNSFLSSVNEVEVFFGNQRSLKPSKVNLYRPQLGSFGSFKQQVVENGLEITQGGSGNKTTGTDDGVRKWTKDDLELDLVLTPWFNEIEQDFDLILIQEYFFMSLALLIETFCWAVDDVIIAPSISWLDSIQPDAYQNKLSENSVRKVFQTTSFLDAHFLPWTVPDRLMTLVQ